VLCLFLLIKGYCCAKVVKNYSFGLGLVWLGFRVKVRVIFCILLVSISVSILKYFFVHFFSLLFCVVDYANLCQLLSTRNIVSCIILTKTPQQRWLAFSCGVCFQSSLECFQWHATVLRCCWQSVIVVVYSKDWLCCVIEQWRDGITSGHPTGRWVITLHGRLHHSKHQQVPYTTTNTIFCGHYTCQPALASTSC